MILVRYGLKHFIEDTLVSALIRLIIRRNAKWLRIAHKADGDSMIYHRIENNDYRATIQIQVINDPFKRDNTDI